MKTVDFIREHNACRRGARWALSVSDDMSAVWDAMIAQDKHEWLFWVATRPGVFPDSTLRKLACRFVRETPLCDGRTVWDLLTDERSRKAVEVAEAYVDGNATEAELAAAYSAACSAVADAYAAAAYAADVARAAADVAYSAAYAANAAACAAGATDAARVASAARTAYDAAAAARDAAHIAAYADDAAYYAAAASYAAADDVARAGAYDAQIKMIAELGNPFKKESPNENR